ncbi:hypothetical protein [Glaciimonas soli]|uniref:Glycosyltransferase RgtA/B/C/D-like domain-containing protein n=1 Tax=Glaciimonas soli TaxID=2590999 RepID=A0A843YTM5_9BURK|nr:hypothetical protein [Glaciimonas soli]MQR02580.1 hypothetical protein [Glaciimonas soli]
MAKKIPIWIFIATALVFYLGAYLHYPALPGNDLAHPEGWWGWFDQGEYLKATRALSALNFDSANHRYPPLYPLLGALFYKWWPNHPFFFVNGLTLLWFVFVYVRISDRYVSRTVSFVLLFISLYCNTEIFINFVIPWTTTVTVAVYSFALYGLAKLSEAGEEDIEHNAQRIWSASGYAAIVSLLVLARPVDAGPVIVFFPAYLYLVYRSNPGVALPQRLRRITLVALALGIGLAFGVLLYLGFNQLVYGSALGGYFQATASSSGYFPSQIFRKSFSLLFDGGTVFLEQRSALVSHYPWLILSILGMCWCFFRGDWLLRTIALVMICQFCLYAPYGDLLPNGVWRYHNIHYFKWTFPYLALFAWLLVRWAFIGWRTAGARSFGVKIGVVVMLSVLLLMPRYAVTSEPGTIQLVTGNLDVAQNGLYLGFARNRVDFIDIYGLSGGFSDVYFGEHRLYNDGKELQKVRDFRLLPAPWGVRLLFNKPLNADHLIFAPGQGLAANGATVSIKVSSYGFELGRPHLFHD